MWHFQNNLRSKSDWGKLVSIIILVIYLIVVVTVKTSQSYIPEADAVVTFATLAFAVISFFIGALPLELTALIIPVTLSASGVLSAKEAFASFSDSTILTFGGMFIVGGAVFHTGLAERIGWHVLRLTGGKYLRVSFAVMLLTAVMSSVLSNTGTAAVLLPIVCAICDTAGWSRKRLLYPMAVMCSAGGMITVVGTPPNIAVNSFLQQYGYAPVGFFEFAAFGIPMAVASIIYLTLIEKLSGRQNNDLLEFDKMPSKQSANNRRNQLIAGIILLGVVAAMISGLVPLEVAAIAGALACVITGVLTKEDAYKALDMSVLFLFAGALALSIALNKSGAGTIMSNALLGMFNGRITPRLLITLVFVSTNVLTHFMSNTACFALMAPIGMKIAASLGVSPYPIIISIAFASSAAFATPVATPPNTMIVGPAKMTFRDFIFIGFPLTVIAYFIAICIIPYVWTF